MEKDLSPELQSVHNGIPLLSMNERIMASLEESIRSGQKIEFIPFKKWQAQRCEKHNCKRTESV